MCYEIFGGARQRVNFRGKLMKEPTTGIPVEKVHTFIHSGLPDDLTLDALSPEELQQWLRENGPPEEFDGSFDELLPDGTFRIVRESPVLFPVYAPLACEHGRDGKERIPESCDTCAELEQRDDERRAREGLASITMREFVVDLMADWQVVDILEIADPRGFLDNREAAALIKSYVNGVYLPTEVVVAIISGMQSYVHEILCERSIELRHLRECRLAALKSDRAAYRARGVQFCETSYAAQIATYEALLA